MPSETSGKEDILSLVSGGRPGGRMLFAFLAVVSALLLIQIGSQTEPGFEGGGWWNEPRNGPLLSLSMLFFCSVLAAVFAAPSPTDGLFRAAAVALFLAAAFLAAVWLIPKLGYGLSVLVFSAVAGAVAGFRGGKLILMSFGLVAVMLVIFRYLLGLWFPRAALFKLHPWLEAIGGYL